MARYNECFVINCQQVLHLFLFLFTAAADSAENDPTPGLAVLSCRTTLRRAIRKSWVASSLVSHGHRLTKKLGEDYLHLVYFEHMVHNSQVECRS